MRIPLIREGGKFYKTNLHCHTTISDGQLTPEEVKAEYVKRGYSAVCFTDHEVLIGHEELCDDGFIALHGYEAAIKEHVSTSTLSTQGMVMPVYHFCFIAKSQDNLVIPMFFKDNPSYPGNSRAWIDKCEYNEIVDTVYYHDRAWLSGYIRKISEGGFIVNYNHPEWSLQTVSDVADLDCINSIEVANSSAFLNNDNTTIHYAHLLRCGRRVYPTGSDDTHSVKHIGGAWTMLKADELSYDSLIKAYEDGEMYASWGPEIHSLFFEDGKIKIKTSNAMRISLHTEGRYASIVGDGAKTVSEAEFDYIPEKFGRYFRLEVRDASGNIACTVPYYVSDLNEKITKETENKA
ncbi:MAG: hypothetical protein J6Q68_00965 [Clostridia bacterium]|nr:hypothetical protein [Clostridia bacterium]